MILGLCFFPVLISEARERDLKNIQEDWVEGQEKKALTFSYNGSTEDSRQERALRL